MSLPVCALRHTGRVLGLVVMAVMLGLGPREAAAQERVPEPAAGEFEAGLFEVRIGRAAAQTVIVQVDPTGRVLLPVDAVLGMAGLPAERTHPDSARAVPLVGPTGRSAGTAVFDLRDGTMRTPDGVEVLQAGDAAIIEDILYLAVPRLERMLRASIQVDFGGLVATITRTPPFPVEQALIAEQRRAAAARRRSVRDAVSDVPYSRGSGGAVLDWNVSTMPDAPQRNSSAQADLGIAILGGDLTLGGNYFAAAPSPGRFVGNWNYTYNAPRFSWLRQVQLGDLLGGGGGLRALRGLSFTNSRLYRDGTFSDVELRPEVPAGWSYEVYQDGQLLGFADDGTAQSVRIPLRYGSTPVQVRMLGPAGEEVVSDYRYQIPSTQLSPRTIEYTAGVGRCIETGCDDVAFARADWGVSPRLTVGGSAEYARHDTSSTLSGGLRAAAVPARDWYATLDIVPDGRSQLQVSHDSYEGIGGSVAAGMIRPGGSGVTSVGGAQSRWFGQVRLSRQLEHRALVRGVRTEFHLEGFDGAGPDRLFASVTTDTRYGTSGLRYEHDPSLEGSTVLLSHLTLLRRRQTGPLTYLPVTGTLGLSRRGVERIESALTLRSGRRGSVNLVARWSARSEGAVVSISYDALLRSARVSSRAYASARATTVFTSAGGAVAYAPRTGMLATSHGGTGSAGVAGRVFYDNDGDGQFTTGDEPAPGVGVVAGSGRVMTDAAGQYRAWSVLPYEPTTVYVDTLRDIQPDFIPLRPAVTMRATANMYNRADFALVRTRELAGQFVAGEGIATVGGLTVQLTDTATKRVFTAVTFSDGAFYISRVRPGLYELRVAESSRNALGAAPIAPVIVHVSGTGPDLLVEVPPIEIRGAAAPPPPR